MNENALPADALADAPTTVPEPSAALDTLTPPQALDLLIRDPVGFVGRIVDQAAALHLSNLKEEAELRGALNAFRKLHPEFARFEPFILQEVAVILKNDEDGAVAPWPELLAQGMARFQAKFAETVQAAQADARPDSPAGDPYVESATNRATPEPPPHFTRAQLAAMSPADFLKNEAAINQAMKEKRIR